MRSGLVIAGVAVAVVGAGLLLSLFFLPAPPVNSRFSSVAISDLGPNATNPWIISEDSASQGTLVLTWSSQGPVSVSLYTTVPCQGQGVCPAGKPLVTWNANTSGAWSYHGAVGAAYLLSVLNFGHASTSFVASLTETYTVPTPSQAVPAWALITVGGLFLLGIGGIAMFLGLFLEPGIYRPPRSGYATLGRDGVDPVGEIGPEPVDVRDA